MSDENIENPDRVNNIAKTDVAVEAKENFAELLEKSVGLKERLSPGQKVKASVVSISGDLVYIDLGGKSEGVVDLNEFMKEDGSCSVQAGDEIEAYYVTVRDGVRRLTTMVNGYAAVTLAALRDAFEAGVAVEGTVKREVKGGFEVTVGGVRCFCPFSQIDLKGGREGGLFLGRSFPFKVLEFEENGKNVILSRRALLEGERKAKIEKLRETLSVGMDVTATVRSIQNFGTFVDLGGVDGLIPASEISWDRAKRPADAMTIGQEVTARIIALEWERNRLTLSLKALEPDPWAGVKDRYTVDGRVNGLIVRLAPFGVFVRLEPGVEGLIHISNLGAGRRINHPKEVVEAGQEVEVYVLGVDEENRKISLSMQPKAAPKVVVLPEVGKVVEGVVDKVMPFGIFVKIGDGLSGLVPNSEIGATDGDPKRIFAPGAALQTVVVDVEQGSGKIRLSRKALMDKKVKEEYAEYVDTVKQTEGGSSGLGSLGDILKAKLQEKKLAG
ncbi:MAG: S1 RNA-binding domain-containing protein [Nitrospiraceae bacterium]|nr:S1 RNA-binding domain-containing protein [Nitrospiraceae bacterium]